MLVDINAYAENSLTIRGTWQLCDAGNKLADACHSAQNHSCLDYQRVLAEGVFTTPRAQIPGSQPNFNRKKARIERNVAAQCLSSLTTSRNGDSCHLHC
jgi:hypothetical protein